MVLTRVPALHVGAVELAPVVDALATGCCPHATDTKHTQRINTKIRMLFIEPSRK
jgi:hypothetical protein